MWTLTPRVFLFLFSVSPCFWFDILKKEFYPVFLVTEVVSCVIGADVDVYSMLSSLNKRGGGAYCSAYAIITSLWVSCSTTNISDAAPIRQARIISIGAATSRIGYPDSPTNESVERHSRNLLLRINADALIEDVFSLRNWRVVHSRTKVNHQAIAEFYVEIKWMDWRCR